MGKVITPLEIYNLQSPQYKLTLNAFVDSAAAYLTLPAAWKSKLGNLRKLRSVKTQFADQRVNSADVYGPVLLKIEGFDDISTEVMFIDMLPDECGEYEPLLGYIPLEQANATIDMTGRKLLPLKYVDVK
jgi:hypothetical protein